MPAGPTQGSRRRWLVTGAAGFIGSNLVRSLLERGETVVGLDNFASGRRENIDRLERRFGKEFSFHEGDILDSGSVAAAMDGCAAVAHLAAQISDLRSISEPEETHAVNGTGFFNVYIAAARAGVASFVYASSCAVYGDNPALPLSEDAVPRPQSPYAATKLANEAYGAGMATAAPQMAAVGLRFFNIFGAWQDASGGYAAVIPKWIGQLMAGQTAILYGDGSATRDFCHVDNVCEAFWRAADRDSMTGHNVFNVGTGIATRLDALYATICEKLEEGGIDGPLPPPKYEPAREGEIRQSVGDMRRAEAELGFRASIDLGEGLRRLLIEQHGLSFAAGPQAETKGDAAP